MESTWSNFVVWTLRGLYMSFTCLRSDGRFPGRLGIFYMGVTIKKQPSGRVDPTAIGLRPRCPTPCLIPGCHCRGCKRYIDLTNAHSAMWARDKLLDNGGPALARGCPRSNESPITAFKRTMRCLFFVGVMPMSRITSLEDRSRVKHRRTGTVYHLSTNEWNYYGLLRAGRNRCVSLGEERRRGHQRTFEKRVEVSFWSLNVPFFVS